MAVRRGSDPDQLGPGRIDVFARGTDNALLHVSTSGSGWSSWESLGGALAYDPAVDSAYAGNLDVFAVDTSGFLSHKYFAGGWSGWQGLGSWQYTSGPSAVTTGQRALAFARGTDAALDGVYWTPAGWNPPGSLGGVMIGTPSAVSYADPIIDVFVRGDYNYLYHRWFNGSSWAGYTVVGGPWAWPPIPTPSPGAAARRTSSRSGPTGR